MEHPVKFRINKFALGIFGDTILVLVAALVEMRTGVAAEG
jgi:hypothetical protein